MFETYYFSVRCKYIPQKLPFHESWYFFWLSPGVKCILITHILPIFCLCHILFFFSSNQAMHYIVHWIAQSLHTYLNSFSHCRCYCKIIVSVYVTFNLYVTRITLLYFMLMLLHHAFILSLFSVCDMMKVFLLADYVGFK